MFYWGIVNGIVLQTSKFWACCVLHILALCVCICCQDQVLFVSGLHIPNQECHIVDPCTFYLGGVWEEVLIEDKHNLSWIKVGHSFLRIGIGHESMLSTCLPAGWWAFSAARLTVAEVYHSKDMMNLPWLLGGHGPRPIRLWASGQKMPPTKRVSYILGRAVAQWQSRRAQLQSLARLIGSLQLPAWLQGMQSASHQP